jgi:hypothetical protein
MSKLKGYLDVGDSSSLIEYNVKDNTDEEKKAVVRVICGAEACNGPEDAKHILDVLGLLEPGCLRLATN